MKRLFHQFGRYLQGYRSITVWFDPSTPDPEPPEDTQFKKAPVSKPNLSHLPPRKRGKPKDKGNSE